MSPKTMLEKNRRMKALPRSIKGPLIKMLASGRGVRPSARWLRDTAGYMKDVQLQSVERAIERWVADEPELFRAPTPVSDGELDAAKSRDALGPDDADVEIDELEEMKKLVRKQWDRIEMDAKQEKTTGALLPDLGPEIKLQAYLLVQMANVKAKQGLYPKESGGSGAPAPEAPDQPTTQQLLDAAFGEADMHEIIEGEGRPFAEGEEAEEGADLEEEDLRDKLDYKMALRRGLVEGREDGAVRVVGD
jgi:hypothetical protein